MLPTSVGISPYRSFPDKSNETKLVKYPIFEGMIPDNSESEKSNSIISSA